MEIEMLAGLCAATRRGAVWIAVGSFTAGILGTGCAAGTGAIRAADDTPARLYDGLGTHTRTITTKSPEAHRYFNQGLIWMYAFNHDEAIRSFAMAAELDPDCAMAYWGVALCHGPHINNPVVPEQRAKWAWAALCKAAARKAGASPVERALIEALEHRYANPQPADRAPLDKAYADAMAQIWKQYPNDSDVGTLYAEALMDLRPWNQWHEDGSPNDGTDEVLSVLETVMAMDPNNPGANHLYIHAVEASPDPARANAAADRLRNMVPASGHLVHMPSHIDVLTGRWAKAAVQNERAIAIDTAYREISPKQGFYRLYMFHNHHMLSFAAMMEGRGEVSIRAAREMIASVPLEFQRENAAMVDGYAIAPYDALKRFGRWDEILAAAPPPDFLPITNTLWHFTRGVAFAAKGDIGGAIREQEAFEKRAKTIPVGAKMAISPAETMVGIARHMLDGEIEFRKGNTDQSVAALRKAIELEDSLNYMEPPEWVQPVRHTLGAVLLSSARYDEAEQVYREDLKKWPENGWSLWGLSRSLKGQGRTAEAADVDARLAKMWTRADVKLSTSCLCIPNL
jgi:tetratricopeptide (TPR) repeat protein